MGSRIQGPGTGGSLDPWWCSLGPKVDVWALGVVLYQLMFHATPSIASGGRLATLSGILMVHPRRAAAYPEALVSTLYSLFNLSVESRPPLSYVCPLLELLLEGKEEPLLEEAYKNPLRGQSHAGEAPKELDIQDIVARA